MFPWRWCHGGLRRYRLNDFPSWFWWFLKILWRCFYVYKEMQNFPGSYWPLLFFALHWKASCAKKKKSSTNRSSFWQTQATDNSLCQTKQILHGLSVLWFTRSTRLLKTAYTQKTPSHIQPSVTSLWAARGTHTVARWDQHNHGKILGNSLGLTCLVNYDTPTGSVWSILKRVHVSCQSSAT